MLIHDINFISAVCILVLFLISHFGEERGWYRKKGNWFSRTMHFFGGFLVAMFWSGFTQKLQLIIIMTFGVGVLWEIWEYFAGIFMKRFFGRDRILPRFDTIEDLICDVIGAVAWLLILAVFV